MERCGADGAVGNWKVGADWKCSDMHSRLSDWLGRMATHKGIDFAAINWVSYGH